MNELRDGSCDLDLRPKKEPAAAAAPPQAKRVPVDYLYAKLNWDFIKMMAQIAQYAEGKYGAAEQYTESRLVGEKAPMNHVFEHARQYLVGEPHDRFGTVGFQLASIAYNAMMEYFYYVCNATKTDLYRPRELPPAPLNEWEKLKSAEAYLRTRAVGSGPLPTMPVPLPDGTGGQTRIRYAHPVAKIENDQDPELEAKAKSFDRV